MTGREFLSVAIALASGATEAEWRSSISRAYYAAFHVAKEFLTQLRFRVPAGEQAHAYLWLRLSNTGDPKTDIIGRLLRDLRGRRNLADYDLTRARVAANAQDAINDEGPDNTDGRRDRDPGRHCPARPDSQLRANNLESGYVGTVSASQADGADGGEGMLHGGQFFSHV